MPNNTVLIVDDQLSAREVLRGLLTGQGYHLVFAASGEEALRLARQSIPDVILLDVMMPGMDGFEVCRRARSDPQLAEAPILLVTALDDRDSRLKGIQAGADDFISKPFDQHELRARVQTIVKLNRYRRLHTERAKFEWLVDRANFGHLILNDADQIVYANMQARLYLEIPLDAELPILDTFPELVKKYYNCEPQAVWNQWPNLMASSGPAYLVRPATDTSESLWLQVEQMAMASDAAEKYLINLQDVTEDMNAKRLMWTFHAQIGHKLRTPVMLVSGSLDMLHADKNLLCEDHKSLVSSAYKNALRLQSEIQDILQYLDTSHIATPADELCDVNEIANIVEVIKTDLNLESVTVDFDENLIDASFLHLPLSRRAIETILQEILENSLKFHPHEAPLIALKISEHDGQIRIQILDDGLNLQPEQLSKIWYPYYQIERYFTGQVNGMGLGLASVASLVWDVGGACHAYNRGDGPGLVIELVLPIKECL